MFTEPSLLLHDWDTDEDKDCELDRASLDCWALIIPIVIKNDRIPIITTGTSNGGTAILEGSRFLLLLSG